MVNSLDEMVHKYYHSVGRNTNLLIGIVIDTRGLVPETDVRALKSFGEEIKKRFDRSLLETSGEGEHVVLNFDAPTNVNHVMIMEDITQGERIRVYLIEGKIDGKWTPIATGQSVGHKRIQQFDEKTVMGLRLSVQDYIAVPKIRKFAAYYIN